METWPEVKVWLRDGSVCEWYPLLPHAAAAAAIAARLRYNAGDGDADVCARRRDDQGPSGESDGVNARVPNGDGDNGDGNSSGDDDAHSRDIAQPSLEKQTAPVPSLNSHCWSGLPVSNPSCWTFLWLRFS